jgi:hypothetical protein
MINEYGVVGGMRIGRGNRNTRRKPTSVSLYPPQIPHKLTWNPGRRSRKLATNRLSYGTALLRTLVTIIGVRQSRSGYLSDKSLEPYRCANLPGLYLKDVDSGMEMLCYSASGHPVVALLLRLAKTVKRSSKWEESGQLVPSYVQLIKQTLNI